MVDKILVVDFGSQSNQLIARRLRSLNVFSELVSYKNLIERISEDVSIKGLIFSGGPMSVYNDDAYFIDPIIYTMNIPILGICYGMQMMVHQFNGVVQHDDNHEYGKVDLQIHKENKFTKDLIKHQIVWMSHQDQVKKLPKEFINLASSKYCEVAMIQHIDKPLYGVQFHPELTHTTHGDAMLHNFAFNVCDIQNKWEITDFIENKCIEIQQK